MSFFADGNIFKSYLLGYLFVVSVPLGALGLLLLHTLTGGSWGRALRPCIEPMARTMPLMAVLFLPIAFGLSHIYVWAGPEAASNELIQAKLFYLNGPFFLARAAFYFAAWNALAHFIVKWSREYVAAPTPQLEGRLQLAGGLGLVLFAMTGSFAAFDWAMSLEPEWYSTIYGLLFLIGAALEALALSTVILGRGRPVEDPKTVSDFHDFGNLMLAFVMLWAYMSFSQFLLIWSANLPEEIPYYLRRSHGAWLWVGIALVLFHFALPFFLLLMRFVKRNLKHLPNLALAIVFAHLIDVIWLVNPAVEGAPVLHWMDVAAIAGVSAVWLFVFGAVRKKAS